MLRGVIAAIGSMIGDDRQQMIVGAYADALEHAAETLELPADVPAESLAGRDVPV